MANGLQARHELGLIDADVVGHRALEDSSNQTQIREAFGERVFSNPTTVDRSTLAKLVFGEHESQIENRKVLEQIVHPWINTHIEAEIEKHRRAGKAAVLLDAAVLLESGWGQACQSIAFIDTPEPIRQQRVQQRGWSSEELAKREASQLSLDEKKSLSDIIIDNSGSLESAIDALDAHLNQLLTAGP